MSEAGRDNSDLNSYPLQACKKNWKEKMASLEATQHELVFVQASSKRGGGLRWVWSVVVVLVSMVEEGGGGVAVLQEWSFQPLIRMSKA